MLPDTITTQSAMVDSMAQSFGLSHKRCDEREPGTTRTARGQQTAQSIKNPPQASRQVVSLPTRHPLSSRAKQCLDELAVAIRPCQVLTV